MQPDYIGKSNPLDEKDAVLIRTECIVCGSMADCFHDGDGYCADCLSDLFAPELDKVDALVFGSENIGKSIHDVRTDGDCNAERITLTLKGGDGITDAEVAVKISKLVEMKEK